MAPQPETARPVCPRPLGGTVGQCVRPTRALRATDRLATAADVLRNSPLPVIPVVHGQGIVGLVGLSDLPGEPRPDATVSSVMRPPPPPLAASEDAGVGLRQMVQHGLGVAPVVDPLGDLLGLVTRADLSAVAARHVRPARCGGMATPLGVYLTTGHVRAGAGDLGLVLAGASMGALALLSLALVFALAWLVDSTWDLGILSGFGLGPRSATAALWRVLAMVAWFVVYSALFRLSPLAGYHAAEHMTVNAIESGRPLDSESVSRQSRVHPRCGTNLVVVVVFFALLGEALAPTGTWLGITALAVVLSRTLIGGLAQQYVTTRPPTDHELTSGVSAGIALVESHQSALTEPGTLARRLWCMGLAQSMAGFVAVYAVAQLVLGWLDIAELLDLLV